MEDVLMKTIKVLSIGNSFSSDSTRYVHEMAKCVGVNIQTANLYIPGCPLYLHYINAMDDRRDYILEFNGIKTGFKVSIKEALISDEFDIVTVQQVSIKSYKPETFQPYLSYLEDYIHTYRPGAKIYIHQTWGYYNNGKKITQIGFANHSEMYGKVELAYDEMYSMIDSHGLLPSGKAINYLHEAGIPCEHIHRDDIHLSLGLGRYTSALVWVEYLTGIPAADIFFSELDEEIPDEEIAVAKDAAHKAVEWALARGYKK